MIVSLKEDYLRRFIKEVARNSEASTCKGYEDDIRYFLMDMMQYKNISSDNEEALLKDITNNDVEDWLEQVVRNDDEGTGKYAPSTVNRKLISLNLFFRYLQENKGIIERNPFANIKRFKKYSSQQSDILTLEEVRKVLNETYIKQAKDRCFEFNSARIRLIIALMCTTGMRIGEVLSIELDDIEVVEDGYMININAQKVKNDINKRVPICGVVVQYYEEYIAERNKLKKIVDDNILILSSRGKAICRKDTERDIKKYVDRADIDKDINNHSYRHIFRTSLTKNNVNESLICIIGGWSRNNLSMSAIYTHDTKDLDREKMMACNIL